MGVATDPETGEVGAERDGQAPGAAGISQADRPGAERPRGAEPQRADDSDLAGATVVATFEPSLPQWQLFQRLRRFNVIVCHRGFGKSYLAVNLLIRQACKKPGTLYAFLTDTYQHAKDIAWDKILKVCLREAAERGVVKFWEADLRVTFANGSEIKLYGVDTRPEALRGLHLDGVVFDEYALIPPHVWEQIVFPTLQRKSGGAIFIGTPQGRNHFYRLYQYAQGQADWFAATVRADESGVYTPEQLALAKRTQSPEMYAQEMECSFETAVAGAYYAAQLRAAREQGRIRSVPWEPSGEVETWWDLGFNDSVSILFVQQVGREIHVIDFLEAHHEALDFYAKALQTKPYVYARHHLPHDGDHHRLEAGGKSAADLLKALNVKPIRVHPKNDPVHGIQQARLLFSRCWFDAERCGRLLDCLAYYHAKVDAKHDVERSEPEHDWSSHAADAFRYMAVGLRAPMPEGYQAKPSTVRFALSDHVGRPVIRRPSRLQFDAFRGLR